MRNITLSILTAFLLLSFAPIQMQAATANSVLSTTAIKTAEPPESDVLIARINEINAMDMTNLSSVEKRHLRKELRSTKNQLRQLNGGVYLSAGAIIIVILLLILLL